jgi:hypothetical protein
MMSLRPDLQASEMRAAFAVERASATPAAKRATRGGAAASEEMRARGASASVELSLEAAQRWFQAVVTHPESAEAGARAAGAPIDAVLKPGAKIDAATAIGVYHHAYLARLVSCLEDDYPALAHAMGHARFHALAASYVARFPSRSPNLNAYGRHMATHCAEQPDAAARFWADLARLEWALVEMIHAEDAPPLPGEELARMAPSDWASAKLVPSDTLRVLRFEHPVNGFYRAFREHAFGADRAGGDDQDAGAPEIPAPAPEALAVYRQGFTLWRMELTPAMAELLEDLARGTPLGPALAAMEARFSDPDALTAAAKDVMAWFSAWVTGGFFRAVERGTP